MSKIRAFLLHLSISATIVGIVCALIFFVWYPQPFFKIAGAGDVLKVLIGVDLVVGPMLTLILYKPGKPKLLFDMSCVALIQIVALVYGTSVIFMERPYYLVFAVDRFEVLAKKDIDADAIPIDALRDKPLVGPIYAVALMPEDEAERQKLLTETLEGKPDLERRPEYWDLYANHANDVAARGLPLDFIVERQPEIGERVQTFVDANEAEGELQCIPVMGKQDTFCFIVDKSNGQPVGLIDVDPWMISASSEQNG